MSPTFGMMTQSSHETDCVLEDDDTPKIHVLNHSQQSRTRNYLLMDDMDDMENMFVANESHNAVQCQQYLTQASKPLLARQAACNIVQLTSLKKTASRTSPSMNCEAKVPLTCGDVADNINIPSACDDLSSRPLRAPFPAYCDDVAHGGLLDSAPSPIARRHGDEHHLVKPRSMSDVLPYAEQHPLRYEYHPVYQAIQPGDVLFVQGSGALAGLAQIGSTGGFAGHTMLVVAPPTLITSHSLDAFKYRAIWPDNVSEIWLVPILECARGNDGLLQSELLVRVDHISGKFIIFGDVVTTDGVSELSEIDDDIFEIWQSPSYIRRMISPDLLEDVVTQMQHYKTNWSLSTCVRAVFRTARIQDDVDRPSLFREVCDCWSSDPICTSVVIIFWQRCFCKLRSLPDQATAVDIDDGDALDLIMRWMPLKADRGLPGELLQTLMQCGWIRRQEMADIAPLSKTF